MTQIISDIRDFVTDMATQAVQSVSSGSNRRKVALITGITGQVIIIDHNN